jgi:hypothetical protein
MSLPSIVGVTRALQRVPGVLLAEVNGATAQALVAHDSAVKLESLVAAAAGAGVPAHVRGPAEPNRPALEPKARLTYLSVAATAVLVIFASGSLLLQREGSPHWPIVFCCLSLALFVLTYRRA